MMLKEIFNPIKKELSLVDNIITRSLKRTSYKSIQELNDYVIDTSGKKLRPALVIFSAKASNSNHHAHFTRELNCSLSIAAAVELIHTASLIHDDIIDKADTRRGKPSINKCWGEDISITLGDYLFSKAFEVISNLKNSSLFNCLSEATFRMCEGQLIQIKERDNIDLSKSMYMLIIKKKTACLIASCCKMGGIISGCNRTYLNALNNFGINFGMAFQIADDCMDLIADKKQLGKAPGQDLFMGELTLPILNLISISSNREKKELKKLLMHNKENTHRYHLIKEKLLKSEALAKTKITINRYVRQAKKELSILPKSTYRGYLDSLMDSAIKKDF